MAKEIERKFLVTSDQWRKQAKGTHYKQGYLNSAKERTVRIRTIDDKAFLTIKGPTIGITRQEYEYEIPHGECEAMLENLAEKPIIEKSRYKIEYEGLIWEIDEFFGVNEGLIVAEVELKSEGQVFNKPEWVGEEVSSDPRYLIQILSPTLIPHGNKGEQQWIVLQKMSPPQQQKPAKSFRVPNSVFSVRISSRR